MTTVTLEVNNPSALNLMHLLDKVGVVMILKEEDTPEPTAKVSDELRSFSKEAAESFRKHVEKIRSEWD
ncbi:MAG: hypothetical protein LBT94_04085 [Prevotellaceae bacterium]|jgi:hypothetical protein|nr:hypothetical protein [Prevotellaceae bacterium]